MLVPPAKSADETELERARDVADNLVLQREHVRPLAVETFRPEMAGGRAVDQLCVDADVVADPTYRAFQQIPNPQCRDYLCGFRLLVLIGEGGVAGDDEKTWYARQFGRQVLGETVCEILLLLVVA